MFYLTDKLNQRQIYKIYKAYEDKKLQIRAEYQINIIQICSPENGSIFIGDKFKNYVENQK